MLSPEQQASFIRFLNTKWANQACPMCRVNRWNIGGWITMLVSDQIGIVLGSPVMPMIAMSCDNCGNTLMINAIAVGVMPPDRAASQQKQPPVTGLAALAMERAKEPGKPSGGSNV